MNKWSEIFNIPYPACNKTGNCCRFSSPSTPGVELLRKAAENNEFARDYLSIFIPYSSIEEVKELNSKIVEKNLEIIRKSGCEKVTEENMVFYYCRFIAADNTCMIYEDRPSLCREFPDSPFLVFPENCAYKDWSIACKREYAKLNADLEIYKRELANLRSLQKALRIENKD